MQAQVARKDVLSPDVIRRAGEGDARAFGALLDAHGPMVYGLCRRLTPDPDDCYQEIWEKVSKALSRFEPDGPASLATWIRTIAHRHLVDRHRRRLVRGEVIELGERASDEIWPDQELDRARSAARLESAIQRLPEAQRRVVVMHHMHEVDLETIAADEDIAVGTVKSRLHRGRARLAEILGGAG